MKTIGIIDRADGNHRMKAYIPQSESVGNTIYMLSQKRIDRIYDALNEIKHTANIDVYLINGNKQRKIFSRGF